MRWVRRLALPVGLAMALCTSSALAKDKGLPNSTTREKYCAEKFGACWRDGSKDCRDTYDRPDHVTSCSKQAYQECVDAYLGASSRCMTNPKGLPTFERPGGPAENMRPPNQPAPGPPPLPRKGSPRATR